MRRKRPHHRYHNASYQSLLHNGNVHDSAGELNLGHLHIERDETCRCMITGTFTTAEDLRHLNLHNRDIGHLKRACNCGTFAVFCTLTHGHVSLNTTGMSTTLSNEKDECNCVISTVSTDSTRGICWTCPTGTSTTLSMNCIRESIWFSEQSGPKDSLCATTGMSTTVTSVNCACGVAQ